MWQRSRRFQFQIFNFRKEVSETIAELYWILIFPEDITYLLKLYHDPSRSFLLNESRYKERKLLVYKQQAHTRLAIACLRVMSSVLR